LAYTLSAVDYESGTIPSGWTQTGNAGTYTYNHTPALEGSSSFALSGSSSTAYSFLVSPQFGASQWFYGLFKVTTLNASAAVTCLELRNSSDVAVAVVQLRSSNAAFTILHGATSQNGSNNLSAATLYYMWINYVPGSGANGALHVYYSTTTTRPGSPSVSITTGTATTDAVILVHASRNRGQQPLIFDGWRAANEEIFSDGLIAPTLVVADCTLAVAMDGVVLVSGSTLAVADSTVSISFDSPALSPGYALTVGDASLSVSMDGLTLDAAGYLVVSDASIAISADSPVLVSQNSLAVADAAIAILMDSMTLGGGAFVSAAAAGVVVQDFTTAILVDGG